MDFYNLKISEQNYNGAIDLYTKAIQKNWKNAVYFANRSISNLRLENFGYALSDASRAIELDKGYTKAYYRRAAAHMSLGKYKLALKDFEYVSIPPYDSFKLHVRWVEQPYLPTDTSTTCLEIQHCHPVLLAPYEKVLM